MYAYNQSCGFGYVCFGCIRIQPFLRFSSGSRLSLNTPYRVRDAWSRSKVPLKSLSLDFFSISIHQSHKNYNIFKNLDSTDWIRFFRLGVGSGSSFCLGSDPELGFTTLLVKMWMHFYRDIAREKNHQKR